MRRMHGHRPDAAASVRWLKNRKGHMDIIAHDENSLTNLLFSEIHRCDLLPAFLATIVWRNGATFPINIRRATLHQQVGFSGFGRPDAIIIIEATDEHYHVVIVE